MKTPNVDQIMRYEEGEMDFGEAVDFIQEGINEGWVWILQGSYGRAAQRLIDQGLCYDRRGARNQLRDPEAV